MGAAGVHAAEVAPDASADGFGVAHGNGPRAVVRVPVAGPLACTVGAVRAPVAMSAVVAAVLIVGRARHQSRTGFPHG